MIAWLNELRELLELHPSGLPWDSVSVIRREYENLLDYARHHYTLELTSDGWIAQKKPNWRKTCTTCGSSYVVDGVRCRSCADGA